MPNDDKDKARGVPIATRDGAPLMLIPLSLGGKHGDGKMKYALIDAADYPIVKRLKWYAAWSRTSKNFYSESSVRHRQPKSIQMSRLILGLESRDDRQADHVSRVTLDNRRSNLRVATSSQNQLNVGRRRHNVSGFKGVSWHQDRRHGTARWRAQVTANGRRRHLGHFRTAEEAAVAYDRAVLELHGAFAITNALGHDSLWLRRKR
jgi:hypothetical protein